jgi:hypothetical protein
MRRTALAICALSSLSVLSGCGDTPLFSAPERGGSKISETPIADSVVSLVANVPYSVLATIANAKIPLTTRLSGDGHIGCVDVPYVNPGRTWWGRQCFVGVCTNVPQVAGPSIGTSSQCADYHWYADIAKEGSTSISRDGNFIRLAQGVHITGRAGVGGTLASILSLSGKDIGIQLSPRVNVAADLDKDWCPIVTVVPIGTWVDSATVEVVGKTCQGIDLGALGHPEICAGPINLGLAGVLNQQLDDHLDDLQEEASKAIACDAVKPKLAPQWHAYSIKVERGDQPALYLNIYPKSASFSGLVPGEDRLQVAVRIGAQTILTDTPADPKVEPLPPLEKIEAGQGGLEINLQAVAPYPLLKEQLRTFVGQDFKKTTPAGEIDVRIDDVDIYPTKDSLALGIKVDARLPGSWFDSKGWVYLIGRPAVINGGRAVTIEDLRFASVVDNNFWKAAATVFEDDILKTLNSKSTFDLGEEIDKASQDVLKAVEQAQIQGLKIKAGAPTISLHSVFVSDPNLVAVAKMTMPLEAEVTDDILK